jgi:hypothetical protein
MQIGIDTDTKTINLYGKVNLRELLNTLKALDIDKELWSIEPTPKKEYIYPVSYPIVQSLQPNFPNWPQVWCGTAENVSLVDLMSVTSTATPRFSGSNTVFVNANT